MGREKDASYRMDEGHVIQDGRGAHHTGWERDTSYKMGEGHVIQDGRGTRQQLEWEKGTSVDGTANGYR